jgi:hypothetical protein
LLQKNTAVVIEAGIFQKLGSYQGLNDSPVQGMSPAQSSSGYFLSEKLQMINWESINKQRFDHCLNQ